MNNTKLTPLQEEANRSMDRATKLMLKAFPGMAGIVMFAHQGNALIPMAKLPEGTTMNEAVDVFTKMSLSLHNLSVDTQNRIHEMDKAEEEKQTTLKVVKGGTT